MPLPQNIAEVSAVSCNGDFIDKKRCEIVACEQILTETKRRFHDGMMNEAWSHQLLVEKSKGFTDQMDSLARRKDKAEKELKTGIRRQREETTTQHDPERQSNKAYAAAAPEPTVDESSESCE